MEKNAQEEIKSKINKIELSINDGNHALDEKIKMVKSTLDSAKESLTGQIQRTNVSLIMKFEKNSTI